jgi:guanylate kinase
VIRDVATNLPDSRRVYLRPASLEPIEGRLRDRGVSEEEVARRLAIARKELEVTLPCCYGLYDRVIEVEALYDVAEVTRQLEELLELV